MPSRILADILPPVSLKVAKSAAANLIPRNRFTLTGQSTSNLRTILLASSHRGTPKRGGGVPFGVLFKASKKAQ